jgi:hypothetical protein
MLRKRIPHGLLLAVILAVAALALPGEGQAYNWAKAVVEPAGSPGYGTSIAVHPSGDILISYQDAGTLNYAICDISASGHGNCDQTADWKTTGVDSVGFDSSLAVSSAGDPMVSYNQNTSGGVKFAICDVSASAHGNCDQTADWKTVALGGTANRSHTSLTVDAAGNPMIAYYDAQSAAKLRYAVCNISASVNGNCDDPSDWKQVTVDPQWDAGAAPSIRVDSAGNVMISYWYANYPLRPEGLRFAYCRRSSSSHGWCDTAADWITLDVDVQGSGIGVGGSTSLALTADGDPVIAYNGGPAPYDLLRFATCDISASTNGNCNQTANWRFANAATPAQNMTNRSIAMAPSGQLLISYYDPTNQDLKLASCQTSASANGNCDQASDWVTETVDEAGDVGESSSVAVDNTGRPVISYYDDTNDNLKFAIGAPLGVGGMQALPDVAESPGSRGGSLSLLCAVIASTAAAAGIALTAGTWYARRRSRAR